MNNTKGAYSSSGSDLHPRYPQSGSLFDALPLGIVYQNLRGQIISANPAAEKILGLSLDQMRGVTSIDPHWQSIHEDGSPFPGSDHPSMVTLRTGNPVLQTVMGVFNPTRQNINWININSIPIKDEADNAITGVYSIFEDISELKSAQLKKEESELRFASLFSNMLEGVALHQLIYDISGKPKDYLILEINPAYEKHTGLAEQRIVNRLASEIYGTGEPPFIDVYAQVERTKIGTSFEHYFLPLQKHFLIHVYTAGPGQFVTIFEDITARKQDENMLRFHSQILNNLAEGIYLIGTTDQTIVFANPRFEDMFGYVPGELLGKHVSVVNAPGIDSHPPIHDSIISALERTGIWSGEEHNVKKDGSLFWCYACVTTFEHPEFGLVWISEHLDITERKQSEHQLRIAATAFEAHEGMVITDADTVILQVNQAFTQTTGYPPEDAKGQTPRILKSGLHNAAFYQEMWSRIAQSGSWQGEIWNRRKNGETYPEFLTITAVKNEWAEVTNYIAIFNDISERKYSEDKIKQLAYYDQLTQLPNRTLLHDRVRQAFATSARSNLHGALLFIDLDNFKTLNDTLGQHIGDLLLQQVAERLLASGREGDTVARIGGDEFVIILENLSALPDEAVVQSKSIGEKILTTLCIPYPLDGHDYLSTPSIGFALFKGHGVPVEGLMKQADIAMYQAKAAGRNTLRFFDQNMQDSLNRRTALENDLRQAIHHQQFSLFYQVQVDRDDHIVGAEALIRWSHPERGMVSPAEFIPLAEETGLILAIGQWVLETACLQLVSWTKAPNTQHLRLAVNVSVHQFRQEDFAKQVLELLERTGADPGKLKLEMTESLLVDNVEDVISKMNVLRDRGVSFSLDDFGTGYSSLSYLKRLPLEQLKIDQGFVRDLLTDPNDAAIARTIVALAQSMGLNVIAEGVETMEQRDFLAIHGCNHFQGFLFGKPVSIEQFESLLSQR
ncbi:MAG: EAL domain-containing protein [Methylicorpusculum sp.]|uniref:EAL domain-containing protein n=2 Tax=Methylicorpusculum sp. TaxID=2713644 RepID=UPI00271651D3|nr:EAL domain-containing protein [Methylicorpusculum sp.]MDO8939171.1 EAL domain-containing protein [Methylicorpusculum sp.]MDO9239944.1 EAL domain-containing protein [Methylicorpusculum sp.]MDP2201508.1 EAL domain-containing protein [Methylicorpusculum sp.]